MQKTLDFEKVICFKFMAKILFRIYCTPVGNKLVALPKSNHSYLVIAQFQGVYIKNRYSWRVCCTLTTWEADIIFLIASVL